MAASSAAGEFPTEELRQSILQYVSPTMAVLLGIRSCSSVWRSSLERSPHLLEQFPALRDVRTSRNGRGAVVLFRGELSPLAAKREVDRPIRSVILAPAAAAAKEGMPVMTERQLYRVFHVLDTVLRSRPTLDLRVTVDYRGWHPRQAEGPAAALGFSDPDTIASITPQQLVSLSLGSTTPLHPSVLGSMLSGCYQLAHLCIEQWCDNAVLTVIAKSLPNLSSLALKQSSALTDASLQFASSFLTRLHTLEFCECAQITDKGLAAMVRGSGESLRKLALTFCERMTDLTLTQIASSCGRQLLVLDVSGCPLISPRGVLMLFTDQCKLQELHVNFVVGVLDKDVLEAILEYGWTVQKISAAFTHAENTTGSEALLRKLRTRGCDVMC